MADEKSRIEKILEALLGYDIVPEPPQSRIETLLCQLLENGLTSPTPSITVKSKYYLNDGIVGKWEQNPEWTAHGSGYGFEITVMDNEEHDAFIPENAFITDVVLKYLLDNEITERDDSVYNLMNIQIDSGTVLSSISSITTHNYIHASSSEKTYANVADMYYASRLDAINVIGFTVYYIEL